MDTEDGQAFLKHLAHFVRTHEKALANALQLRKQGPRLGNLPPTQTNPRGNGTPPASPVIPSSPPNKTSSTASSTASTLAAALSLPLLAFTSHTIKSAKLSLTPHHLFYLLSRFEELNIAVGAMNVRLENIHTDTPPANYVSFLSQSQRSKGRVSDRDSMHSVSSVRSVMAGMSSLWSSFGLSSSNSAAKTEKAKAANEADLKYLYSAFTKIPCLRMAPDRKSRLIAGYEEFPFDTAVPLIAFKNLSALEICDIDFRQFFGWDRLAEQLKSLTVKRANLDDPTDLLINIVLDDMDKRRRRSSRNQPSPVLHWATPSPSVQIVAATKSNSAPGSPKAPEKPSDSISPLSVGMVRGGSEGSKMGSARPHARSGSPVRPTSSRAGSSYGHVRSSQPRIKRSGSTSSRSSSRSIAARRSGSSSNLLASIQMPTSKWRFLKHLGLADNGLTELSAASLAPVADTLHSLDLSSNHFYQLPDCLASLSSLRALNLSDCRVESLHSLSRNPLPAITALNLRDNSLRSIAGIEGLHSLERLDLRENLLTDPTELARLTGIPEIREVWVMRNPFTQSAHRVTIFNLFRNAPGYKQDIILDGASPGYTERRQLVDRVAESPNVPVVKVPTEDYSNATTIQPTMATVRLMEGIPDSQQPVRMRPWPQTHQSDTMVGSPNRKRKGPRRRVVELSRGDGLPAPSDEFSDREAANPGTASKPLPPLPSNLSTLGPPPYANQMLPPPQRSPTQGPPPPRIDTVMASPFTPSIQASLATPTNGQAKDAPDWSISSEIYRKKIEALRNDVGNNWLAVLNEDGWDGQRSGPGGSPGGDFSPASTIRPSPTTPRASSQPIVSGSRTLG